MRSLLTFAVLLVAGLTGHASAKIYIGEDSDEPPAIISLGSEAWNRTLNVPFVKPLNNYTGGEASMAMLLQYAGVTAATVEAICKIIYCGENGVGAEEFITVAKHYGFGNAQWASDDDRGTKMRALIGQSTPLIAHMLVGPLLKFCNETTAYAAEKGKYMVVSGLIESTTVSKAVHCVVANDPTYGKNTKYSISFWDVWNSPYGKYRYFVLGSKGTPAPTTKPTTKAPTPAPNNWNRIINVPYVHQPNSYTCGPSSLSMLLQFAGTSAATVTAICNYISCGSDGIGEETFITVAKHYGYSHAYWASDDSRGTNMRALIAKGTPFATHMKVGPFLKYCDGGSAYQGTYGHYIVVSGLVASSSDSSSIHCVVSNDPAREKNTKYSISFWEAWTSPYGKYRYFVLGSK